MLVNICDSRVKRLQLQVRRLLWGLVAIGVKATNKINCGRQRGGGKITFS